MPKTTDNMVEKITQKSEEEQKKLIEQANDLRKLAAKRKLEGVIETFNKDFPNKLPEGTKATDDIKANLATSLKIEKQLFESMKNTDVKSTSNQARVNNILNIGKTNTELVEEYKKLYETDANKELTKLIEGIKKEFPNMLPKDIKVSNNINENFKTCEKIQQQFVELMNEPENKIMNDDVKKMMVHGATNTKIMNEYKSLRDINLHEKANIEPKKGKGSSAKTTKSWVAKIKSAPSEAVKKVTGYLSK